MAADGPICNRRLSEITRPHGTIYLRRLHKFEGLCWAVGSTIFQIRPGSVSATMVCQGRRVEQQKSNQRAILGRPTVDTLYQTGVPGPVLTPVSTDTPTSSPTTTETRQEPSYLR